MMSDRIVGSVLTKDGSVRPFVLDATTGELTLDTFASASPTQSMMTSSEAARKRVLELSGGTKVRLGEFHCSRCGTWVDVARNPTAWSGEHCANC